MGKFGIPFTTQFPSKILSSISRVFVSFGYFCSPVIFGLTFAAKNLILSQLSIT